MKPGKFLLLAMFALTLAPHGAEATMKNSPFPPYIDRRFDDLEDVVAQDTATEGAALVKKYAKAVYDVAVDGGSSTSHALGVTLPAGAIITALHVYINTAFTDSGTGSVALQCAGTSDLMGYVDITGFPKDSMASRLYSADTADGTSYIGVDPLFVTAASLGASVPTACAVTAVVRGDSGYVPQTAGKLTAIIEYFNRN